MAIALAALTKSWDTGRINDLQGPCWPSCPTFFPKNYCTKIRVSERMSCEETAIFFANIAYILHILLLFARSFHSRFAVEFKKNLDIYFNSLYCVSLLENTKVECDYTTFGYFCILTVIWLDLNHR